MSLGTQLLTGQNLPTGQIGQARVPPVSPTLNHKALILLILNSSGVWPDACKYPIAIRGAISREKTTVPNAASDASALSAAKAARAALPNAGRHSFAKDKTPASGSFDDLLASIPDAPPESRQSAAERSEPTEPRASARSERPERSTRTDRADRSTGKASDTDTRTSETRPDDGQAPSTEQTPAAADASPGAADTAAKSDDAESKTGDTKDTDTTSSTQAAVSTPVPQVLDIPVPPAAVIDPSASLAQGETTAQEGSAKDGSAKSATLPVAAGAGADGAGQKQAAAANTDQTAGLSADDADVLSALAAKAHQGLKGSQGDKSAKKAATDSPARAATSTGETAPSANAGTPAQAGTAATTNVGTSDAKPVTSEIAKVAAEHQRGQGDAGASSATDPLTGAAGASNGATVKGPDSFATHLLSPTANTIHTAGISAATGKAQSLGDDKPVSIANVAVEVSARISSGKNQFDIRLDPEELGKIHVKVQVDRDGNISTHMVADRPDTLDLLRRDMQGLERALQDAGLKTSDNGMQFSLRDQTANQQQQQPNGQAQRVPAADDDLTTTLTTTVIARDYGRYGQHATGLDIRV